MIINELKFYKNPLCLFKKLDCFLFVILFFFICNILKGQAPSPKAIDSIRQVVTKMPDGIPKFELLDNLALRLREVDINLAFSLHQEAAKIIEKIDAPDKKMESLYTLGQLQIGVGNFGEAEENLKKILTYIETKNDTLSKMKSGVYKSLATIFTYQGRFIEAVNYIKEALKYVKEKNRILDIELNLGVIYNDMGLGLKALEVFLPNIKYLEPIAKDPDTIEQLVSYYINTANVYNLLKEPKTSLDYCGKILKLYQQGKFENPLYLSQTYGNIGNSYMEASQLDSCLVYYKKSLSLLQAINAPIQSLYALLNIGQVQIKQKKFEDALKSVQEAWSIQSVLQDKTMGYAVLISLAMVVVEAKKDGWAEDRFIPSLREFGFTNLQNLFDKLDPQKAQVEMPTTRQKAYKYLGDFYKSRGEMDKAYYYQEQYLLVTDTIFQLEKDKMAANLTFQYDVEKKEKQLVVQQKNIAELENDKNQRQKWFFGLALLTCVLAMGVFYANNQRKQEQKEKEFLKKEEELTRVQLENTKLVLEQKKQELILFTQTLVQKNELIQELEGMLQNLDNQQQELQQQKIQQLHQQTILTEEDWENFKKLFSEVHTSFLKDIQIAFPSLTQAEVRLFMLLKLDFSVQHIAGLLGISADSVHKTKYRLRKRLELESNKDLKTFIQNFGEEVYN